MLGDGDRRKSVTVVYKENIGAFKKRKIQGSRNKNEKRSLESRVTRDDTKINQERRKFKWRLSKSRGLAFIGRITLLNDFPSTTSNII